MAGKTKKTRHALALSLVMCAALAVCRHASAAPEPQFRLDMDNLNLSVGVSCYIAVTMENAQGSEISNLEGFENFDILSTNSSTSQSTIGGETTYTETQYYTLMPRAAGQCSLKVIVQYGGVIYETNTLEVTVYDDPSNIGGDARDVFVNTSISKDDAYLGEKIILTYELYSRLSIDGMAFTDTLAIDGVITRDVPENTLGAEQVYIDGVMYTKFEVKKMVLDPIKSGAYLIPSFNLQVDVISDSGFGINPRGFMGNPFGYSEPRYLQTDSIELGVKPLPTEGKPKDFSGVVGQLRLEGAFSGEQVNYGDSISLRATVSGMCNLDGLKKLFPAQPPGFSVYETQKGIVENTENNQYHVQKEFEAILVPEKNGIIDIAPVSISYFDPATGTYERAEIPGASVEVLGDMPGQGTTGGQTTAVAETIVISQVSYAVKDESSITLQLDKQVLYGILIGLGVLVVAAVVMFLLLRNRKKKDPTLRNLLRRLSASTDVNEVFNTFCAMVKHRYDLSLKASARHEIQNRLAGTGLADQVGEIMDFVESSDSRGENGYADLKERIKGVCRLMV